MATYQDDYRDQDNQGTGNDQLGENTEQTPLANSVMHDKDAENEGWENNKPGITTENENDQRIPTVTPHNENGEPGSDNLVDDNRILGAMDPQNAGYSPDKDGTDDEDLVADDDDLSEEDDDTELIPVETEDDDDSLDMDEDEEDADLVEGDVDDDSDDDLDPLADRPTTFQVDSDFASRDHGRVTGTMTDHEPGLPGSGNSGAYNL